MAAGTAEGSPVGLPAVKPPCGGSYAALRPTVTATLPDCAQRAGDQAGFSRERAMSVPISTKTGEWINEAVATMQRVEATLDHVATELERQSELFHHERRLVLVRIASQLKIEASRLRQAELPF